MYTLSIFCSANFTLMRYSNNIPSPIVTLLTTVDSVDNNFYIFIFSNTI